MMYNANAVSKFNESLFYETLIARNAPEAFQGSLYLFHKLMRTAGAFGRWIKGEVK